MKDTAPTHSPEDGSWLGDAALADPADDLLQRAPFAHSLAKAILDVEARDGFVFGLFGPWGSGKTTTMNFVLHYIEELVKEPGAADKKPAVVRFNPWWFSGEENLLLQFFEQMRLSLNQADVSESLKQIGSKMQLFAAILTPLAYVPVTKVVFSPLKDILRAAGETVESVGTEAEADVLRVRREIDDALRKQDEKILVIIDDIDRLTAEEIRMIFRLVKCVADFPQTVYLVAFDREVVVGALQGLKAGSGEGYLQKIVQVPFDLPRPNKPALRRLLFAHLDSVLRETPEDLWDGTQWSNVYLDGIDHFISTPRDVKRFANALRSSYPTVAGEVNAVDFVAIEALRVFVAHMYGIVRDHSDLFTGTASLQDADASSAVKKTLEQFLNVGTSDDTRKATHEILSHLFPKYATAFGGSSHSSEWESLWRKQRKVCSPAVFPVYFQLSVPEGAVSAAEMRALINVAHDSQAFARELERLSRERGPDGAVSRVREALELLETYTQDAIPQESIPSVIRALFDAGDEILRADAPVGPLDFGNDLRVLGVVDRLLLRYPNQGKRFDVLRDVISDCRSIAMIANLLVFLGREHGKYDASGETGAEANRTVGSDQLRALETIALGRIEDAAQSGVLAESSDLRLVLAVWEAVAASPEQPKEFATQLVSSDRGMADFLESFLSEAHVLGATDRASQRKPRMGIPQVRRWADTEELKASAESLLKEPPGWLTDRQRTAVEVFLIELEEAPHGRDPWDRPKQEQ